MKKVLTIGSVTKDIFLPTEEGVIIETPEDILSQKKIAFELGAKYHIKDRHETLGGCPINVAAGLVKLEEVALCYSPIGNDSTGEWIEEELTKCGIDTKHLVIGKGLSDASSIIVDSKSGERTIFSSHNASEDFIVLPAQIGNPDWIFIGDLSGAWQKNLDTIMEVAKQKRICVAFNPRQKNINEDASKIIHVLNHTDILFLNKDEAMEMVMGCGEITVKELLENEEYLVKVLHRFGAKIVALTDGERGAWGYDGNNLIHAQALLQKAVDTTGAGDAFTSGFFASHLKRHNLETSLRWGIVNSAGSVKEYGGQKGLLDLEEIVNQAEKVAIKHL